MPFANDECLDPASSRVVRRPEDLMTSNEIIVDTLTEHLHQTRSLREGARLRKLRDGYRSLVDNENWLSGQIDPLADSVTHGRP